MQATSYVLYGLDPALSPAAIPPRSVGRKRTGRLFTGGPLAGRVAGGEGRATRSGR